MTTRFLSARPARAALAALAVVMLTIGAADARPGFGGSFGSRGSRTFSAPPSTYTAPRPASPIERSITQPGSPGFNTPRPAPGYNAPGGFRPGFGTGFVGGLLGAGLLGMLFGHGLFGGLGGIGSLFGLLIQFAFIGFLVMMVMRFFRSRQPAMASAGAPYARTGLGGQDPGGAAPLGGGAPRGPAERSDTVGIGPADYEAFERSLKAVNAAWDAEDLAGLRSLATPEMVAYFGEDLARNAGRGLHDRVSDVALVRGDLAEAWNERGTDYATVAMRFSLKNALVDRATGRVVEGDLDSPQEVAELWTFRREGRGPWLLSAIQQA